MTNKIVLYISTGYGYIRERTGNSPEVLILNLWEAAQVLGLQVVGEYHDHMHWKNRHNPDLDREELYAAIDTAANVGAGLMIGDIRRLGPHKEAIDEKLRFMRDKGVIVWLQNGQVYDGLTVARYLGEVPKDE
jgi:hypothetical protein